MDRRKEMDLLAELISEFQPGCKLLRAWNLSGGISANMVAVQVEMPGGENERFIVRQPLHGTMQQRLQAAKNEFQLLQTLHHFGLPVPAPLFLNQLPDFSPFPCLILEYKEGQPVFSIPPSNEFAFQMAEQLARIHQIDLPSANLSFLPRQQAGCPERTVEPASPVFRQAEIWQAINAHRYLAHLNQPSLLHGDFWHGNLLWEQGQLTAVVDWEDAQIGDPLEDLAITRLDLLWISSRSAMQDFTRRYLQIHPLNTSDLPYWDLCAALRLARLASADLAGWAAFFEPYGRSDITAQTIAKDYQGFVADALQRLYSLEI